MARRPQSSCFTNDRWTYDVFLSFRGEDTRYGFTGNLYDALRRRGIHTFIDDESLQRGQEISPSLFEAIQKSRIAIIIFSKNYATSTYCLDELVHILKYLKGEGRLVLPIFYYVDPSQVRRHKGSYGQALARHEQRFKDSKDKVQKWRLALSEAANLSGWHLQKGIDYEHCFIEKIIEQVSKKINRTRLYVTEYPVGLESRVREVNSLLEIGSNNIVKMVGIYGTGGIGKTTIARAVYNLIGDQFEDLCFLSNIREESNKHGLFYLQEMLLREVVGEKDIRLGDVNRGISIIEHRLYRKRVLLVLDDVDKIEQLQALAGRCDWFGHGSRIIITTRDKHLLTGPRIESIYVVKELNHEEALQLISLNAFGKDEIHSNHLGILKRAVLHCSGLPLALEVIGSNFCGKSIEEWNSALSEYERAPDKKVLNALKWSYDALEDYHKEIFLDVACFFNGDTLEYVKDMLLSVRGINPEYAIGKLVDKSLIKIKYGHGIGITITMHDLIQEMGKDIVRQESIKEPSSRSRLWSCDDVLHVLQEDTGTDKIEALALDMPKGKEIYWNGKAFKKMKNLRMLIVKNACFYNAPQYLPNSLRALDWRHYPWKFLPSDFHPTNLVTLHISNISDVWFPSDFHPTNLVTLHISNISDVSLEPLTKKFENLSRMNLKNCEFLKRVPDLSEAAMNLEELCLDGCPSLIEIHNSVGFLSKLRILCVFDCNNLRIFPHAIKLPSLEVVELLECSSLRYFPEVLEKMEKTTVVHLYKTAIEELPYSIGNLVGLQELELYDCKSLKQLPTSVLMLPKLRQMDNSSTKLRHFSKCEVQEGGDASLILEGQKGEDIGLELRFSGCNLSDDSLSICLSCSPNLTYLDLSFNSFTILPPCIKECRFLKYLSVDSCKQLRHIEGLPPKLQKFYATDCTSLTPSSSSIVLNQASHSLEARLFVVPGQNVPEWFHHIRHSGSVSFWVRNEFPAIALCFVVEDTRFSFGLRPPFVHINGNYHDAQLPATLTWKDGPKLVMDHTFLFDLQRQFQEFLLKDQWNHVELSCMNRIKQCGIYVCRQENRMENIRFSRPNSLKRTYHDLYNNFNNDLELGCYPLLKKQHTPTYLEMGVCDGESLDMEQQRHLASNPTGRETVSEHKRNDLWPNNNSSETEWLSLRPCWQEPLDYVNWDSISMKSASTSDTITHQDGPPIGIGNGFDGSPRNQNELTSDDVEMEAFYAFLEEDPTLTRQSEETQRALETLQDLLSKDFSLLHQEHYNTMKTNLDYLSNLSADGGVTGEMRSAILELSREFTHWSRDYGDASRKIEFTTNKLRKAEKLEEDLGVNMNHFKEVKGLEDGLCNELVNMEKRKKELEEQIHTASERKREIYEMGKMLKAQRDELNRQVPSLREEQESGKKTQANIKAGWSKLAEKFKKSCREKLDE